MGEGGLDPRYFLNQMQWWEINRYLGGMRRRYHPTYENARLIQWWLTMMFRGKDKEPPTHPSKLYQFAWEKEQADELPTITEEEVKEMQEHIDNFTW